MGKNNSNKKHKNSTTKESHTTMDKSDVVSELWKLSIQCKGLGELFGMAGREIMFSQEGCCGIGVLLEDISERLEKLEWETK